MGQIIDNIIAYRILKMLVIPFRETDAYKLGIINANGDVLIQPKNFKTSAQKDAYNYLQRIVFSLKKLINKLPGGESQLKNLVAALYLVKEAHSSEAKKINEEQLHRMIDLLDSGAVLVEEQIEVEKFLEEFGGVSVPSTSIPANASGTPVSTNEPVPSKNYINNKNKKKKPSPSPIIFTKRTPPVL